MSLGPDESIYRQQRLTLRLHGVRRGFELLVSRFLENRAARAYPSPLRWGWILLTAAVGERAAQLASLVLAPILIGLLAWPHGAALQATLLAFASPLLWILGRRRLQDAPVAVVTLGCLLAAQHGSAVGLTASLVALLAMKDAAALALPAIAAVWWMGCHGLAGLGIAVAAALALYGAGTFVALGPRWLDVARAAVGGHATPYTLQHQRGAPHRLLVDLVLLSPLAVLFAPVAHAEAPAIAVAAVLLIGAHAIAPVRNVRNVLAAELLGRALVAIVVAQAPALEQATLGALLLTIDAACAWRLRRVYDPVTAALSSQLGMPAAAR